MSVRNELKHKVAEPVSAYEQYKKQQTEKVAQKKEEEQKNLKRQQQQAAQRPMTGNAANNVASQNKLEQASAAGQSQSESK